MNKNAPTIGRLLTMVLFAFSCFGLLLFLWLSFGGPTPLKPKGYQFEVSFPEATQLAQEADVRVAGVQVGKVRTKRRDPKGNRTIATLEIESKYAPIGTDARAALRQKTLLGETYVELRLGTREGDRLPEGGRLVNTRVQETTELDEILNALDPFTRQAFRTWQQSQAKSGIGRERDLNDALGNLPEFVNSGGDLFAVLDEQKAALKGVVKNTGVVFESLTKSESQLRALIVNSDTVFSAIASQQDSFAEVFRVFPTFLRESRSTFARLDRFSRDTRPLVRDLRPAFDDLGPTLEALGDFGPDLRRLFVNLDPLIDASKKSLPATSEILRGLRPLLGQLGPWLAEVNPILDWVVGQHQSTLVDVFANLGVATAARTKSSDPRAPGHYLRQFGPAGTETAAFQPTRLSTNRGNAYINPLSIAGPEGALSRIIASFDCINAGGDKPSDGNSPACRTQKPYTFNGTPQRFPRVERENQK